MSEMPDHQAEPPLLVGMNVRTSVEQREFLEHTAKRLDLTISGAVRWCIDQAMDAPTYENVDDPADVASWRELRARQDFTTELSARALRELQGGDE